MAPLGTALQVTHCDSSCGVRHAHSYQGLSPIYLRRWHSTGTYQRRTKPLCEVVQDLPASGSRKARTNTHQRFSKPTLSSLRPLHHTHKPPVLFRTTIFVHFYNYNLHLISPCYLVADTSVRSKQRILKTFPKLAEKADRQPVCIELKLKTILILYKCCVIVLVKRILITFTKIAVKYYVLCYCRHYQARVTIIFVTYFK